MFLVVPVSARFAAMVQARPKTLRLIVDGEGNISGMERPNGDVVIEQRRPDFARSLTRAIADKGGKSV
jgi:hypothetical protein